MTLLFTLITTQALLGGFDNLWHHEITERLPSKRAAAFETGLHAAREFLYAFVFFALAWSELHGAWAVVLAIVLFLEVLITLTDFVVEDRTRRLPALERVLRKDAALEPVGSLTWFSGRDTCMRYVARFFGAPGDWEMVATAANGQPAAATYLRGTDGVHRAFGLAVLTVTGTGIVRIVVFGDPGLVTRFGFPPVQ